MSALRFLAERSLPWSAMKTKVAMLVSIVGVLVAGSAAALVNTQVLGGSAAESPLVVDNAVGTEVTVPIATDTTVATVVGPTPTATIETIPATVTPTASVVTTQASYAIGDGGTVTLDTAGDVLTIVGVV